MVTHKYNLGKFSSGKSDEIFSRWWKIFPDQIFLDKVLSTKKQYFSFLKKFSSVLQNFFFKISTDCHIKSYADLSNGMLFWKCLVPFFRRTYVLSVGFKIKPLRKKLFCSVKTKINPNFAVKPAERSNHPFLLSTEESHFSNICTF